MNTSSDNQNHRRGFTLLELLVVVGIIAFLTSLSVVVMFGITDQANEEATITTIQKINRLLEQRQEAFDRAFPAVEETWTERFQLYMAGAIADDEGVSAQRVKRLIDVFSEDFPVWRIMARKLAYRFEFPQRVSPDLIPLHLEPNSPFEFNDRGNAATGAFPDNGIPDNLEGLLVRPTARQQLIDEGNNPSDAGFDALWNDRVTDNWNKHLQHEIDALAENNDAVHSTESAELLYFMLIHSGNYGASSAGEADFSRNEIADTDGDGLPEFVDAWGNPLRFYRWPTRSIDPSLARNAFESATQPDITNLDEETDLQMVVAEDGDYYLAAQSNGRSVTADERRIAEFLMKGLPRRVDFSPAYKAARASQLDNPAITGDQHILIPPDPLLRDPDDPAGLVYALLESGLPLNGSNLRVARWINEEEFHTPDTFHAPLVVSGGLDELIGLYEPNDVANLGHLAMYDVNANDNTTSMEPEDIAIMVDRISDNLTNRNRRAGGRQ